MRKILTSLLIVLGFTLVPISVYAVTPDMVGDACTIDASSALCQSRNDDVGTFVEDISNALLWVVGILAVIMLIWGGIKYITSAGDANKVTSAKNTILYSVIGLVVAIFAYAIVMWVNANVKPVPTASSYTPSINIG